MNRMKPMAWPLVTLLAGIGATAYIGTDIAAQSARFAKGRDWPSVEGRISTSAVEEGSSYQKYGSDAIYRLRVLYSYTAEGRIFVNDRLSLASDDSFRDRDEANAALSDFPAGASVPVYYQPGDPRKFGADRRGRPLGPLYRVGLWDRRRFARPGVAGRGTQRPAQSRPLTIYNSRR